MLCLRWRHCAWTLLHRQDKCHPLAARLLSGLCVGLHGMPTIHNQLDMIAPLCRSVRTPCQLCSHI